MLARSISERIDEPHLNGCEAAVPSRIPMAERHGYAPPPGQRVIALILLGTIYALAAGAFLLLLTVRQVASVKAPSALTVVTLESQPSLPEAAPEQLEAAPMPEDHQLPTPAKAELAVPPAVPLPPSLLPVLRAPAPPDVTPQKPPNPTPSAPSTPAAPQASKNGTDSWEGRVLAQLS